MRAAIATHSQHFEVIGSTDSMDASGVQIILEKWTMGLGGDREERRSRFLADSTAKALPVDSKQHIDELNRIEKNLGKNLSADK